MVTGTKEMTEDLFGFRQAGELDFQNAAVVFQGERGAYSQQAMQKFFGKGARSFHVGTWRDAMEAIAEKKADFAVLPIENSSAGIVSEIFDLLSEYDNCIVGEQVIPIEHCLVGLPCAALSDITDVYSHPQALMQCSEYLEERGGWERHSVKNTAGAAKKVREDGQKCKAAIAARITKDIYGLKILAEGIQDDTSNSTRFVIVTGRKVFVKEAGKVSICFEVPHKSGSLYRALSHFISHDLNLTRIESRPVKGKTWEYRFFIDFAGNLSDPAVRNALAGLRKETERLRVLGNYETTGS